MMKNKIPEARIIKVATGQVVVDLIGNNVLCGKWMLMASRRTGLDRPTFEFVEMAQQKRLFNEQLKTELFNLGKHRIPRYG